MNSFNFEIVEFGGNFRCDDIHFGKINSSCNKFSYQFYPGVYAMTGDINDGGWSFAYYLTGECQFYRIDNEAKAI